MRGPAALPLVVLPAILLAVGAWTGLCTVLLNAYPLGLALGVTTSVAVAYALPRGWLRGAFTAGWLTVLVLALLGRPEGDWVIVADWHGYTLLVAGLVLLSFGVATIPRRARKPENVAPPT